jgi:hypothetical protein
MDKTSEATHEVKGLWLPEKDLTLARAPLKFIQLARRVALRHDKFRPLRAAERPGGPFQKAVNGVARR